ncbi:hypothetical protein N7505_004307 [Penicillium chrysogenum]|uniref:Uncharacterized protein n=1 Tax=Penicillium chrysogenum TaxID=5076 RepID=A0ABQ8WEU0_PENCH|nr:hypothetical protein N7505_004307 [Penicillium chrysogenum]
MDFATQEPHDFLKSLFRQLRVFESDHPSFDDLQKLGIKVSQVATVGDELIQFDPCFFLPHPDRLLKKYPVEADPDTPRPTTPPRLNAVPTFDQLVEELQGGTTRAKKKSSKRQHATMNNIKSYNLTRTGAHRLAASYIQKHSARDILPLGLWRSEILLVSRRHNNFVDFPVLTTSSPSYKKGDPQLRSGRAKGWDVKAKLRYSTRNGTFRPHMIISTVADVAVNDTEGLTTPELKAIVNMILIRVNHRPFRNCHIHPMLVLSFLGPQKGRIIQALYDGEGLTLQHSQLWTFEDPQTAPVELFVRYNLGQPVGLEMSTICVR